MNDGTGKQMSNNSNRPACDDIVMLLEEFGAGIPLGQGYRRQLVVDACELSDRLPTLFATPDDALVCLIDMVDPDFSLRPPLWHYWRMALLLANSQCPFRWRKQSGRLGGGDLRMTIAEEGYPLAIRAMQPGEQPISKLFRHLLTEPPTGFVLDLVVLDAPTPPVLRYLELCLNPEVPESRPAMDLLLRSPAVFIYRPEFAEPAIGRMLERRLRGEEMPSLPPVLRQLRHYLEGRPPRCATVLRWIEGTVQSLETEFTWEEPPGHPTHLLIDLGDSLESLGQDEESLRILAELGRHPAVIRWMEVVVPRWGRQAALWPEAIRALLHLAPGALLRLDPSVTAWRDLFEEQEDFLPLIGALPEVEEVGVPREVGRLARQSLLYAAVGGAQAEDRLRRCLRRLRTLRWLDIQIYTQALITQVAELGALELVELLGLAWEDEPVRPGDKGQLPWNPLGALLQSRRVQTWLKLEPKRFRQRMLRLSSLEAEAVVAELNPSVALVVLRGLPLTITAGLPRLVAACLFTERPELLGHVRAALDAWRGKETFEMDFSRWLARAPELLQTQSFAILVDEGRVPLGPLMRELASVPISPMMAQAVLRKAALDASFRQWEPVWPTLGTLAGRAGLALEEFRVLMGHLGRTAWEADGLREWLEHLSPRRRKELLPSVLEHPELVELLLPQAALHPGEGAPPDPEEVKDLIYARFSDRGAPQVDLSDLSPRDLVVLWPQVELLLHEGMLSVRLPFAWDEVLRLVRAKMQRNLEALAARLNLPPPRLPAGYPSRPRLEQAWADLPKDQRLRWMDACQDDILSGLLETALLTLIRNPELGWEDLEISGAGAVANRIFEVWSDSPVALATTLYKLLEKPAEIPVHWIRGLVFALVKLREPLGEKVPKLLARLSRDPNLPTTLREVLETQVHSFDLKELERYRSRPSEIRVRQAQVSLLQAEADST